MKTKVRSFETLTAAMTSNWFNRKRKPRDIESTSTAYKFGPQFARYSTRENEDEEDTPEWAKQQPIPDSSSPSPIPGPRFARNTSRQAIDEEEGVPHWAQNSSLPSPPPPSENTADEKPSQMRSSERRRAFTRAPKMVSMVAEAELEDESPSCCRLCCCCLCNCFKDIGKHPKHWKAHFAMLIINLILLSVLIALVVSDPRTDAPLWRQYSYKAVHLLRLTRPFSVVPTSEMSVPLGAHRTSLIEEFEKNLIATPGGETSSDPAIVTQDFSWFASSPPTNMGGWNTSSQLQTSCQPLSNAQSTSMMSDNGTLFAKFSIKEGESSTAISVYRFDIISGLLEAFWCMSIP